MCSLNLPLRQHLDSVGVATAALADLMTAAQRARLVIAPPLAIVPQHAAASVSVPAEALVVEIVQPLASAHLLEIAHRAVNSERSVHLATALTEHHVTIALPTVKQGKMHVTIHAALMHQRHTALSNHASSKIAPRVISAPHRATLQLHRAATSLHPAWMRRAVILVRHAQMPLVPMHRAKISLRLAKTSVHQLAHAQH